MKPIPGWRRVLAGASLLWLAALTHAQTPIRIGSTLALTGPLSATAQIHKLVGEIYVEQLNKRGGLLGRPVEWIVKDDQSKPDLARTLYEQLITADKVDLLMGPYATGAILSAMGVAQRYDKVLIHHTFGIPNLAKYDMQFPAWSLGPDPGTTVPNTVFNALASVGKTPEDDRGGDQQVSVAALHLARCARSGQEARHRGGAVPRVGVRQPRLRADRRAHQGRQARLRVGRRDRPGRQPADRRDEEARLHAAAALLRLPGAGADGEVARRRRRVERHASSRIIRR